MKSKEIDKSQRTFIKVRMYKYEENANQTFQKRCNEPLLPKGLQSNLVPKFCDTDEENIKEAF